MTHDRKPKPTPFNLTKSLSLDRLIEAENIARECWVELEVARTQTFGDTMHPLLHDVAIAAWKAWGGLIRQRAAAEREWRIPR